MKKISTFIQNLQFIFNDMLQNGDECGIFLEGLYNLKEVGDVKIIKFAIGS
jgi:hypothetical protein